jgi:hypothetical protein
MDTDETNTRITRAELLFAIQPEDECTDRFLKRSVGPSTISPTRAQGGDPQNEYWLYRVFATQLFAIMSNSGVCYYLYVRSPGDTVWHIRNTRTSKVRTNMLTRRTQASHAEFGDTFVVHDGARRNCSPVFTSIEETLARMRMEDEATFTPEVLLASSSVMYRIVSVDTYTIQCLAKWFADQEYYKLDESIRPAVCTLMLRPLEMRDLYLLCGTYTQLSFHEYKIVDGVVTHMNSRGCAENELATVVPFRFHT